MKKINKIFIILSLLFAVLHANEEVSVDETAQTQDTAQELITDSSEDSYDDAYNDLDFVSTTQEEKIMQISSEMSAFEKLFVNHSAHIYYVKGVEELYKANYKAAYENAMKAQSIFDNTQEGAAQIIALPYMPSYIRESSYTPKRIYYKIVTPKPYELRRLITKAKLISPPIASVVIKRTSTYMDVITKNYGDLPLDAFEILLNDEPIAKYEKILPNEQKITRIDLAPNLYEISFKEKYGFAPNSILLSEDE